MTRTLTLLTCIVFSAALQSVYAQCVPDQSVTGLYSPTFQEGLPNGEVGVNYETVITLNVPPDTTYLSLTAQIDSMVLTEVTGLPPGYTYSCVPASCGFEGGELGCISVTGIVDDNADAGTYDLTASFLFYLASPAVTLPYNLSEYSITVDSGAATGMYNLHTEDLGFNIEPNPISSRSMLRFDLPSNERYAIDVYTLLGTKVAHVENRGSVGSHAYPLADFNEQAGVYFITLTQGSYTRSMRFIVQ